MMEYNKVIFETNEKEIEDFVKHFNFVLLGKDQIKTAHGKSLTPKDIEFAKANKPKILEYLRGVENKKEERKKKIASIPGLKEVENALLDFSVYNNKFRRSIHDEDNVGSRMPTKPKHDMEALKKKYPSAFLWIMADDFLNSSNSRKYCAGKKAQDFILDGDLKKAEKTLKDWGGNEIYWD